MKKFLFAALAAAFVFAACDDDDDKVTGTLATIDDIVGQYSGPMTVTVTVMGSDITLDPVTTLCNIEKDGAGMVVTIPDFSYKGDNYGDIVVNAAIVGLDDSGATEFKGLSVCPLTKQGKEYQATVQIEGDYYNADKVELDLDMTLPVSQAMTIVFDIDATVARVKE